MQDSKSPYATVKQFHLAHPAFPEGGIRWDIFMEETNGLKEAKAIIRKGRKVLIHVPRYLEWLEGGAS